MPPASAAEFTRAVVPVTGSQIRSALETQTQANVHGSRHYNRTHDCHASIVHSLRVGWQPKEIADVWCGASQPHPEKGFAVFFVTGRPKSQHDITVANLQEAGYSGWTDDIYMQPDVQQGKAKPPARIFKPQDRQDIERKGYRIVLNIGDQASDLAGCCAEKTIKLPNPFYLVP